MCPDLRASRSVHLTSSISAWVTALCPGFSGMLGHSRSPGEPQPSLLCWETVTEHTRSSGSQGPTQGIQQVMSQIRKDLFGQGTFKLRPECQVEPDMSVAISRDSPSGRNECEALKRKGELKGDP